MIDNLAAGRIAVACCDAPRLLHILGVDADDRRDLASRSYEEWRRPALVGLTSLGRQQMEQAMMLDGVASETAGRELNAIYVSVELSRKTWLVTLISPGAGEKLSRHMVKGGDIGALLQRLGKLRHRARERTGSSYPVIVIQEAGLDGFWVHRVL